MAWDDELNQLVTSVREALAEVAMARAVPPARVVDTCGLAGTSPAGRAPNPVTRLDAVDSLGSAVPRTSPVSGARFFDLCGLGAKTR